MVNYDMSRFEKSCRELVKAFENQVSWKWDDRFETALAEFSVSDKESVHRIIKAHTGFVWDNRNLIDAPETIQVIINCFDGLNHFD